jgi:nucleoside-diphosphate-sugar epimerase
LVLVTGANGFIGSALTERLQLDKRKTLAISRSFNIDGNNEKYLKKIKGPDLKKDTDYSALLSNIEVLIHVAARVHVIKDRSVDSLSQFRLVNVEGTLNLAEQAKKAGVKRFIYISSIKVNGETTDGREPFTEEDIPNPADYYAISKAEAESGLKKIAENSAMETVIIRPSVVYGPNVKGNIERLSKLVALGFPLPFASIKNKRSMIAVDNLVDLIISCIDHVEARNQTFLASDGVDLSLSELITIMARVMNRNVRLFNVDPLILHRLLQVANKQSLSQRLLGNLQVSNKKSCRLLKWKPIVSVEEGFSKCFSSG